MTSRSGSPVTACERGHQSEARAVQVTKACSAGRPTSIAKRSGSITAAARPGVLGRQPEARGLKSRAELGDRAGGAG
jgi:hypothetical protein